MSTRAYGKAGLCRMCSAQAAYGHQLGFSRVHPPCRSCAVVVKALPVHKPNGWHALTGRPADTTPRPEADSRASNRSGVGQTATTSALEAA